MALTNEDNMNQAQAQPKFDPVADTVVAVIRDMTSDWDLDTDQPLGPDTQLIGDLAFESIDVVQLVVSLEESFNKRSIPFHKLLMDDGRYVEDLSIRQVVDFLRQHV